MSDNTRFSGWAVVELTDHRKMAGHVREEQVFGSSMVRIEIPCDPPVVHMIPPSSIRQMTLTTEEAVKAEFNPKPTDNSSPAAVGQDLLRNLMNGGLEKDVCGAMGDLLVQVDAAMTSALDAASRDLISTEDKFRDSYMKKP